MINIIETWVTFKAFGELVSLAVSGGVLLIGIILMIIGWWKE